MSYFERRATIRALYLELLKLISKTDGKMIWSIQEPYLPLETKKVLDFLTDKGYLEKLTESMVIKAPSWAPVRTFQVKVVCYKLTKKGELLLVPGR